MGRGRSSGSAWGRISRRVTASSVSVPCSSGSPWHDRDEVVGVRSGDGGSRCAMTVVVGPRAHRARAPGGGPVARRRRSWPSRPWARSWSWRPRRRWPPPRSRYPDFGEAVRSTRPGSREPDPVTGSRCLRNGVSGTQHGQSRYRGRSRFTDHPQPRPGPGVPVARHDDRGVNAEVRRVGGRCQPGE